MRHDLDFYKGMIMRYNISISEKELDDITVQNLKLHRDSLCLEIQDYHANDRILDDYQRSILMGHQEALYGIEAVLKYMDFIRVKY
jgi:hypothetical protein